jgi:hypothetical protein
MSSSVDSGASYWDAKSSKETFEQSGGLTATVVHTFAPYRETRIWGKLGKYASLESILRTTLNPLDLSLTARKHSEYGAGIQIKQSDMFIFSDQADHRRAIPKTKRPTGALVIVRDLGALVLEFCGSKAEQQKKRGLIQMLLCKIDFPLVAARGVESLKWMPRCEFIDKAKSNPKENLSSIKVRSFGIFISSQVELLFNYFLSAWTI